MLDIRFRARALAAVRLALGEIIDIPSLDTEGDWRYDPLIKEWDVEARSVALVPGLHPVSYKIIV